MNPEDFIGKWTLADTGDKAYFCFIDNENVKLSFGGNQLASKYALSRKDAKTILEIKISNSKPSECIVLEKSGDSFLLCLPGDYKRAVAAMESAGWGWSKPFTLWRKKQKEQ